MYANMHTYTNVQALLKGTLIAVNIRNTCDNGTLDASHVFNFDAL